MITVYASGRSKRFGRKQKVYDRRTSPADLDRRGSKIIVSVISTIAILTILGGFCLNQIISSQQNELQRVRSIHSDLKLANDKLLAERNTLLQEERLATATVKLGLYPPHDSQSRKAS